MGESLNNGSPEGTNRWKNLGIWFRTRSESVFARFQVFGSWTKGQWIKLYNIGTDQVSQGSRQFLFLYFSWIIFLIFLSFSFLAEVNPFRLLYPFQVFSFPVRETRSYLPIYVSDGETGIFKTSRYIWKDEEDLYLTLRNLIEEIGRPPHYSEFDESESKDRFLGATLKKLPNLSPAVISFWIREKTLIVNLSGSHLESELSKYRFAKSTNYDDLEGEEEVETVSSIESYYSPPVNFVDGKTLKELEEKKARVLNLVRHAIEKTILANFPNLEKVEFRVDGKRSEPKGLYVYIDKAVGEF